MKAGSRGVARAADALDLKGSPKICARCGTMPRQHICPAHSAEKMVRRAFRKAELSEQLC